VRALGIDVGGSRKGLDVVLLDGDRRPIEVVSKVGIERLGLLIHDLRPDVIAIDAPPSWASNGSSRMTERILAQVNIHAFNTPAAGNGRGHPFYAWMEVGFEVFAVAAARGFPRYRAGNPRGTAMEVFPHGSAAVLAGCLPPKGARKKSWRERILSASGVQVAELTTADRVDAALCALTGLLALEGRRFAPGDPKEGVIVLPAVSLPARPYRPAPAEAHDEMTAPLCRLCGCGDASYHELTRTGSAPGHDAKRKSQLWASARSGSAALDELRRRGWAIPPEMR
jgi:predicted nuclease with RNAse H fold